MHELNENGRTEETTQSDLPNGKRAWVVPHFEPLKLQHAKSNTQRVTYTDSVGPLSGA